MRIEVAVDRHSNLQLSSGHNGSFAFLEKKKMTISQLEEILKETKKIHGDINVKIFVGEVVIDPRPRVLECNGIHDIWESQLVMNP